MAEDSGSSGILKERTFFLPQKTLQKLRDKAEYFNATENQALISLVESSKVPKNE